VSEHVIPGRAHTPEQKRAIIERLYIVWLQVPELRLGQLIEIVHAAPFCSGSFYAEDETLVGMIETWAKEQPGE
jgi:hypothetical protein